jgi:hypothetical protein
MPSSPNVRTRITGHLAFGRPDRKRRWGE